jgi:hypothetical protein
MTFLSAILVLPGMNWSTRANPPRVGNSGPLGDVTMEAEPESFSNREVIRDISSTLQIGDLAARNWFLWARPVAVGAKNARNTEKYGLSRRYCCEECRKACFFKRFPP